MPRDENQGISHQKKTPENPQGDHERSFGHQVRQHPVNFRELRSYTHNPYKWSLDLNRQRQGNNTPQQGDNGYLDQHGIRHYFDQHGRDCYVDQQGNHRYARRPGYYDHDYYSVDQQGNKYYCYVDRYRRRFYIPSHLIPRHQHRPADFGELLNIYAPNIKQIDHGPLPAMVEATLQASTNYFQAVDTTPSDKSVTLYWGGLDGKKGETGMRLALFALIYNAVPPNLWPSIKFHSVQCDPEKNMVFTCVTDVEAARILCEHIHHRFFFDTANQILFHGTTKRCGEGMYQALQTNNAQANGDVAVLVEKNTLRNIVTCEIEDPNYKNRNR